MAKIADLDDALLDAELSDADEDVRIGIARVGHAKQRVDSSDRRIKHIQSLLAEAPDLAAKEILLEDLLKERQEYKTACGALYWSRTFLAKAQARFAKLLKDLRSRRVRRV